MLDGAIGCEIDAAYNGVRETITVLSVFENAESSHGYQQKRQKFAVNTALVKRIGEVK